MFREWGKKLRKGTDYMRNKNLRRVLSLVCAVALLLGMGLLPNSLVYAEESAMPSETDTNIGDNEITGDDLLTSTGNDGEGESSTYREVTFSDFGIEDQTIPSGSQPNGALSDVENLDGVAFTGKLQMGLQADMYHSVRIGGKDGSVDANWSGVGLWTEHGTQLSVNYYTGVISTHSTAGNIVKIPVANYGITYDETTGYSEFKYRVTFDYVEDTADVRITISVNDILAYDGILPDAQNHFGNRLHLWANGGKTITVKSVADESSDEEETRTYREVTFSDFGIEDQTIPSGSQPNGALSDVENLDGVAFTGKLQMGLQADMMHSVRIGGKDGSVDANWSGVGLWTEHGTQLSVNYYTGVISTHSTAGNIVKIPVADYGITYDETSGYGQFKYRVTFDYVENTADIRITISVNDILAYDGILPDAQNYFGNRLHLWANGGKTITVKSVSDSAGEEEEEPSTYREVTFSDFGIYDKTVPSGSQPNGALSDVENLDGVAFTGKIQMGLQADMYHSVRIGGKDGDDNAKWSGVGLWTENGSQLSVNYYTGVISTHSTAGNIVKIPIANYGIVYDEATGYSQFKYRVTFDYIADSADIRITISVNDLLAYDGILPDAQNYFGNRLHLWANGGKTITVRSYETQPATYREVTFSDFGIYDQTINSGTQPIGALSDVENLDGVAFTGKLQMGLCNDSYHSFRLGGKDGSVDANWSGVGLWTEANSQLAIYYYTGVRGGSDIVKIPIANYGITYNETTGYSEFKLRLTFDYIENTTDVNVTVTVNDLLAYDGILTGAQDVLGNRLHLWANGGKTITVRSFETQPATYREVTFSDFGISNQTVAVGGQPWGALSDAENLDGVAFTGYLQMNLQADMKYSFRIGGKEGDESANWSGVGLWTEAGSQLSVNYYTGVITTHSTAGNVVKIPVANYGITYDGTNGYSRFKLRITFDYIEDSADIKIKISVNDLLAYVGILPDAQNYFGNRVQMWANEKTIGVKSYSKNGSIDVTDVSMTLSDKISMNFYVEPDDLAIANGSIQIKVGNGEAVSTPISEAKTDGTGKYIFTVDLAAAQMADVITLQLVVNGTAGDTYTNSVREYAEKVLADQSLSASHALVKNMLNYGAAAQVYFDHNANDLANKNYPVDTEDVPDDIPAVEVANSTSGLSFYGASLLFKSKIAVRFYFTVSDDITNYTFLNGASILNAVEKDGLYYVEIPDINPQDMDNVIDLMVADASGNSLTVSYGPMHYIKRMYNGNGSDNLKALAKALYNYYQAAEDYVSVA